MYSALVSSSSQNFRWVCKGTYTSGPRTGESSVVKYFKSGVTFSETFYSDDIKAVDKAIEIVREFNNEDIFGKSIIINKATVWTGCSDSNRGHNSLVEPFIKLFKKWNSNSGWVYRVV